jgi:hypothetical protein
MPGMLVFKWFETAELQEASSMFYPYFCDLSGFLKIKAMTRNQDIQAGK